MNLDDFTAPQELKKKKCIIPVVLLSWLEKPLCCIIVALFCIILYQQSQYNFVCLCYYTDDIANYLYNAYSSSFLQIINPKWNLAAKHMKPSDQSTINVKTVKLSKAIRHCLQVIFSEDHRE